MWICPPYQLVPRPKDRNEATWGAAARNLGRQLVRVRAAPTQETVWETVVSGRTAESLPVLKEAIQGAERLLGLEGENEQARTKRARIEIREDAWLGQ